MREGSRRRRAGTTLEGRADVALGAVTHVGMHRPSNQDAFCALTGPDAPQGADALVAVADGMGGHRAGEVASTMAIERLRRRLSRKGKRIVSVSARGAGGEWLGREVQHINVDVHQAAMEPQLRGMGTTLTAALLAGSNLILVHVGDSRAYLLRGGRLRRLTRDHSWVAEQLAAGQLTEKQARSHPRRNVLTRALGPSPTVEVDESTVQVKGRDVLLLCSDGLHSLVSDHDLAQALSAQDPQRACETLVELANAHGGPDNITAVVLRIGEVPGPAAQAARAGPGGAAPSDVAPAKPFIRFPARALARLSRRISRRGSQDGPTDAG